MISDFLNRSVRATYVRSEGAATDQDLTGPRPRPIHGLLAHLGVGSRMVIHLPEGGLWRTTPVQAIDREADTLRIVTRRSVYRVRLI